MRREPIISSLFFNVYVAKNQLLSKSVKSIFMHASNLEFLCIILGQKNYLDYAENHLAVA